MPCRITDRDEVFDGLSVSDNLVNVKVYKVVKCSLVWYLKVNSIKELQQQHNLWKVEKILGSGCRSPHSELYLVCCGF